MKANFFKTTFLIAATLIVASCSKNYDDETPVDTSVNPLIGYLIATGFDQVVTNNVNAGDYEFGLSFKPIVNGKITAVVVKIPDANANLRVTIWNKTTATTLRTETINYATAGVEVIKEIAALDVVAGTEYMVTFNSNDWYRRNRTNNVAVTYPITVGDISFSGYSFISGTAQALPNSPQTTYYAGDISFKFVK